jgi:flagellar biosynthesis/type III secretory pathway protein FliH
MIRLLSSGNDGEVLASARALGRLCSLNDLGNMIEETEGKLSKTDMQYLYESGHKDGFEKGKLEGYKNGLEEGRRIPRQGRLFGDVLIDSSQQEDKIRYCSQYETRLKEKELVFIESCLNRITNLNKPLTEAQSKWLEDIYRRLGGK